MQVKLICKKLLCLKYQFSPSNIWMDHDYLTGLFSQWKTKILPEVHMPWRNNSVTSHEYKNLCLHPLAMTPDSLLRRRAWNKNPLGSIFSCLCTNWYLSVHWLLAAQWWRQAMIQKPCCCQKRVSICIYHWSLLPEYQKILLRSDDTWFGERTSFHTI